MSFLSPSKKSSKKIFLFIVLSVVFTFSSVANEDTSKENLLENGEKLRDSVISSWGNKKKGRFLTIEELIVAIKEYNKDASKLERITSALSYNIYYKEIEGAPSSLDRYYGAEWKRIGKWRGFFAQIRSCKKSFY